MSKRKPSHEASSHAELGYETDLSKDNITLFFKIENVPKFSIIMKLRMFGNANILPTFGRTEQSGMSSHMEKHMENQ